MIHGFGGSTFSWKNNVEKLKNEGYLVVAADLPRFGYSDKGQRIESLLSSAYGIDPSSQEVQGYLEGLRLEETPSFIPDFLKTAKSEPIEKLENNKVPILFITAENDTWVPKEEAYKLKEIIPRVDIEMIVNAAHCSMETNYEEFNKILLEFITDI